MDTSSRMYSVIRKGFNVPNYKGIIDLYMKQSRGKQLIAHQLDSFNYFLTTKLQEVIQHENPVTITVPNIVIGTKRSMSAPVPPGAKTCTIEARIEFGALKVKPPVILEKNVSESPMFPNSARLRNLTYASRLSVDVTTTIKKTDDTTGRIETCRREFPNTNIGNMPVMIGSNYCRTTMLPELTPTDFDECVADMGGYFCVQGGERVIQSQERMAENQIYLFKNNKTSGREILSCDIKSVGAASLGTIKPNSVVVLNGGINALDMLRLKIPHVKPSLPVFTVFKALGIVSDKDIIDMIYPEGEVPSVAESLILGCIADSDVFPLDISKSATAAAKHSAEDFSDKKLLRRAAVMNINRYITDATFAADVGDEVLEAFVKTALAVDGGPSEKLIREARNLAIQQSAIGDVAESTIYWNVRQNKNNLVANVFKHDLFPHVGTPSQTREEINAEKAQLLAFMTRRLIDVHTGVLTHDDRDAYYNKRIDTAGVLLCRLFRHIFHNKVIKDMQSEITKQITGGTWITTGSIDNIINPSNIQKVLRSTSIDIGIKSAIATGNFSAGKAVGSVGISQVLNRLNYPATMSHIRRISAPTEKTGKLVAPRKLHGTQWGFMCTGETPEGGSIGIVKNLASTAYITGDTSPYVARDAIISSGLFVPFASATRETYVRGTRIFVNGAWIGLSEIENTEELVDLLRSKKRCGALHPHTSVVWDRRRRTLTVCTEAGRVVRPVYYAGAIREYLASEEYRAAVASVSSWEELIMLKSPAGNSLIEYVDPAETNCYYIAMYPHVLGERPDETFTHCEIHPSVIQGTLLSLIPFSDHNQSVRNGFQAGMGKQAVGTFSTKFRDRMDTMSHVMLYPTRPVVQTYLASHYFPDIMMTGRMSIVAIQTYTGYNQEDSVILNKDAVERGFMRTLYYKTYKDEEKKNQASGEEERFCKPTPAHLIHPKKANYGKLGPDGFVPENVYVNSDDILIGKTSPIVSKDIRKRDEIQLERDVSRTMKHHEEGYVDKIIKGTNGEGNTIAKVRIRTVRSPIIGDKMSSFHSQKGSTGLVLPGCDMPRTRQGIIPDIIMNPHAIPSRMTIAHLMESIGSKAGALLGMFIDASPFEEIEVADLSRMLLEHAGYEPYGNEVLYSGITGEQMQTDIFMTPLNYQRLKHMVHDKCHARASGSVVSLTRQPAEGRAREGGLRFGEMERDAVIAHGCSIGFNRERLLECSDNYEVFPCNKCGLIGIANKRANIFACTGCNNYTSFTAVRMPYACKLVMQELAAMNVSMHMVTEEQIMKKHTAPADVYYGHDGIAYAIEEEDELDADGLPVETTGYDMPGAEDEDVGEDDAGDGGDDGDYGDDGGDDY